jgi:hypothetical protein
MTTNFGLAMGQGFPDVDFVMLGGLTPPGTSYPTGAGSPRKWDKRAGYGITGAFLVYTGADLSEFEVHVTIWTEEHWTEWLEFASVLEKPKKGQKPKAIGIVHPLVNRPPIRITEVVVEDVSQFEPDETREIWTCVIKLSAFKAPEPMLARPSDAIPGATPKVPTAQDAADRQIQALVGEMQGLL